MDTDDYTYGLIARYRMQEDQATAARATLAKAASRRTSAGRTPLPLRGLIAAVAGASSLALGLTAQALGARFAREAGRPTDR